MSAPLRDIYWMSSPLLIKQRESTLQKLEDLRESEIGQKLLPKARKLLAAKEEGRAFHKLKHWTLEVDGWCFELLPISAEKMNKVKLWADACKPHVGKKKDWDDFRNKYHIVPERRLVGQTRMSNEEVAATVRRIWKDFNKDCYLLLTQNCQNFAIMLHDIVCVSPDDPEASPDSWKTIPRPVSYLVNDLSKSYLIRSGTVGVGHFTTALAVAPVGELAVAEGAGAGAVGVAGTTGTGAATTTTATTTATTATSATSVGTGTATATTGGTGAAAGGGTGSTAIAGGSTTQTTAGATKAGLLGAKGAATGTAGAGKVGMGAKLAALGHTAMQGASAAKFAAAAKVAIIGVGPVAGPVGCVAVLGIVGLAAASKRDKRWLKKNKFVRKIASQNAEDMSDYTVGDLLIGEEALLAEVHDREAEGQVADLAEKVAENSVDGDSAVDFKNDLETEDKTT